MRTNTLASLIAVAAAAHVAIAQTDTTFTYQGELNKLGAPVNGACDFRFQLYDAMSGGSAVTSRVTVSDVSVTDGRFNVDLDFGAEVFDGAERWLSVDVRQPAGAGTYSTLTPRQPITRSPYSIQTRGIFVDGNERVGIGTTAPADELHIQRDGAALRIQDDDDPDSFSIMRDTKMDQMQFQKNTSSGNVFIDIDARPLDQISQSLIRFFRYTTTTGKKRVQFYSGDGTTTLSAAIGVGGEDSYFQLDGGRVGIGTQTPSAKLEVITPSDIAVVAQAEVYGVSGETTGENGSGVVGFADVAFGHGVIGITGGPSGSTTYAVRGHATRSTGYDFYATGAGINYGSPSSIRWKNNIEPIADPLGMLAQIRGVYYDWDAEHGGQHDIGFIGEEVRKVVPEIVAPEPDSEYVTGMDYGRMTPLLVEAVNALRAEKDAEIARRDEIISRHEARIAALESVVTELLAVQRGTETRK
ncbi:MAG: tail fiber domain-containing protein [Phycisphaerales bacterium]|nr:tail fiber domain-containing protein [Phycisphaerales bacterium]